MTRLHPENDARLAVLPTGSYTIIVRANFLPEGEKEFVDYTLQISFIVKQEISRRPAPRQGRKERFPLRSLGCARDGRFLQKKGVLQKDDSATRSFFILRSPGSAGRIRPPPPRSRR